MEDLHWVDPSTLELLSLLVDQGPTARILALFTCRPDFNPPWTGRSHVTQVTLPRLLRRQAAELTARVAHGKVLPAEVVEPVVGKTDGVPLFVEELTKMVLESGLLHEREDQYELTGPLPPLAIPTTLHDALMARLDCLATVKGLAQLGATLGREFAYDLLQAVDPWDEDTLHRGLHQLVAAEVLYQQGLPPQATDRFKQALIQDAAYQSLLRSTRQQHHQRIAQVLERRFPEMAETLPALLAHHYTQAGCHTQAIAYWQRGGQRAIERYAYVEAVTHLTKALQLLKTLPETPERIEQELGLTLALGTSLTVTKGWAAADVERAYARAHELCRQMGEGPQFFQALFGLYSFTNVRGRYQEARGWGEQLLALATRRQDPTLLLQAHRALGDTLYWLGEFTSARAPCEQGLALYDRHQHGLHVLLYGEDPGVICLSFLGYILWFLGYSDQALQRIQEALTLARELSHPFSLTRAWLAAIRVDKFRRERHAIRDRSDALVALSTDQGFLLREAAGMIEQGWTLIDRGEGAEGIRHMQEGLARSLATGSALAKAYQLGSLAEAYGKAGQAEEGLQVLADAFAVGRSHGEHFFEAELYRLKGELQLERAGKRLRVGEAAECFLQALNIARHQQAKSLELRAAMSLSRLWQRQGKQGEARELLAEIYGWFTEGFDTADLQEAQALLEELS
jgi:predicted ATPase